MYLPFQGRSTAGVKRRRSGGVALTPEIVAADPTRLALLAARAPGSSCSSSAWTGAGASTSGGGTDPVDHLAAFVR